MSAKERIRLQRLAALDNPCELPEQCAHPRYSFWVSPAQGVTCSVVLTINVGEE